MLYKYYSDKSCYSLTNFNNGVLNFSHVDDFNDMLEFRAELDKLKGLTPTNELEQSLIHNINNYYYPNMEKDQIEMQKFRMRVCCFCEQMDLANMWAYYANNHKGFCLGYDENEIKELWGEKIWIDKVKYCNKTPILTEDVKASVKAQIFHKACC